MRRIGLSLGLALACVAPAGAQQDELAQGVDYRIEAVLDEAADVLRGRARLAYTNRSPATLDTLFFHQHLNAFRPNSAWARRELEFGERRFQDLGPEAHAFERLTRVRVDGAEVRPVYPHAPDSTVVAVPLPDALAPGESAVVLLDWDARPSTLPRRQGRSGRHYDFAQWYPRIAVYDEQGWRTQVLLPQGEFFGEFGSYDVTLDVAADQVIGATGVPVEGDPGWRRAAAEGGDVRLQREFYAPEGAESLGLLSPAPDPGRKRVRWRAEDVHHFAWSTDPAYIYEGAPYDGAAEHDVALHVLYLPGDTAWANGAALERMERALRFLEDVLGPYPYPQLTNVHRLESGGTEFPMLVMNGSASMGLIMHELAHQYAHGLLASNEWAEAWLDEGFASFLGAWFSEEVEGRTDVWAGLMESVAGRERALRTEPVSQLAAEFEDYGTYAAMSYAKGAAVLYMLRELLGEPTFREGLRRYFEEQRFSHVTEADLERAMEAASGRELDWFFHQWLHTTGRLDYGIGAVEVRRAGAEWITRVQLIRLGEAWMPVTVQVDGRRVRVEGREPVQTLEVRTAGRPAEVVVDPDAHVLDMDRANNRLRLGDDAATERGRLQPRRR